MLSPAYSQTAQDGSFWNPDEDLQKTSGSSAKEWDVIVVNDPKMINAQASPGDPSVFL